MEWDDEVQSRPAGPFNQAPERKEIRLAVQKVKEFAERQRATKRLWATGRRWIVWLTGGTAFIVGVSQVPDAFLKLLRYLKGGP